MSDVTGGQQNAGSESNPGGVTAGQGNPNVPSSEVGNMAGTALTGGAADSQGAPPQASSSIVPDWASTLPEEYKSHPSLANYKDLPSFVKSALEQEKLLGKKGLIKPGADAAPEELQKFYNELGRPEKPEGYELKRPESWPKDMPYSEAMVPKAQEFLHKHGLTKEQAQGVWEDYHAMVAEEGQSNLNLSQQQIDQGIQALKQEWGGEEKYNANIETAKMAVKEFGGDELISFLDESGLGDHPALIKAFATAGKSLREDGFVGDAPAGGALSQERAKAEIERLNNDPEFTKVYYSNDLSDKNQKAELQRKMEGLYKIAYPTFTS